MSSCPCGFFEGETAEPRTELVPVRSTPAPRVSFRILRCDCTERVAPPEFPTRAPAERRDYARAALRTYTNEALLDARAHVPTRNARGMVMKARRLRRSNQPNAKHEPGTSSGRAHGLSWP